MRNELQYKREEVIDLFDGQCEVCSYFNEDILEIHHILPLSEGGDNNWDNLSVLCPNCHRSVHEVLNSNNPKETLEKYLFFKNVNFPKFLNIVRKSVNALAKQREVNIKVLKKRLRLLDEEMETNKVRIKKLEEKIKEETQ